MQRFFTYLVIALVASSTLVWVKWGVLKPYHILGFALIASLPFQRRALTAAHAVLRRDWFIWTGFATLFAGTMLIGLMREQPNLDPAGMFKELVYVLIGFALAVATFIIMEREHLPRLRSTALASVAAFVLVAAWGLYSSGFSPLFHLQRAIANVRPDLFVYPVFNTLFQSWSGEEIMANRRHSLALGFLPALALAPLAMRYTSRNKLAWAGVGMAVFILLFTFSRSAWLAGALMGALLIIPLLVSPRYMGWVAASMILGTGALLLDRFEGGATALIGARIEHTGSYSARFESTAARWQMIIRDPLFGTAHDPAAPWAHNMPIDFWSAAGFVPFVLVMLLAFALAARMFMGTLNAVASRPNKAAFYATSAALLAPIFVRMFTIPAGQLEAGTWIALGLSSGLGAHMAHRRRPFTARSSGPAQDLPHEHTSLSSGRHRSPAPRTRVRRRRTVGIT